MWITSGARTRGSRACVCRMPSSSPRRGVTRTRRAPAPAGTTRLLLLSRTRGRLGSARRPATRGSPGTPSTTPGVDGRGWRCDSPTLTTYTWRFPRFVSLRSTATAPPSWFRRVVPRRARWVDRVRGARAWTSWFTSGNVLDTNQRLVSSAGVYAAGSGRRTRWRRARIPTRTTRTRRTGKSRRARTSSTRRGRR